MCGRFELDEKGPDLADLFGASDEFPDWRPRYSIAPTDVVPIVRERDGARRLVPAVWDFRLSFLTKPGRPQFNSRIETVNTNGLWKGAFRSSRCIVPMGGYFEWTPEVEDGEDVKQPHFLHGDGVLAAAGIATARKGDGWVVSFSIITREARDASGQVHDRMPAFLTDDVWDEWLAGVLESEADQQHMLDLLRDVSGGVASTITTYRVSRRVNKSSTADPDDASLIESIDG